jgi:hypothetical protein
VRLPSDLSSWTSERSPAPSATVLLCAEALTQVLTPCLCRISLGTWQYNDTVAADAIAKGLKAGFTHIVRHFWLRGAVLVATLS